MKRIELTKYSVFIMLMIGVVGHCDTVIVLDEGVISSCGNFENGCLTNVIFCPKVGSDLLFADEMRWKHVDGTFSISLINAKSYISRTNLVATGSPSELEAACCDIKVGSHPVKIINRRNNGKVLMVEGKPESIDRNVLLLKDVMIFKYNPSIAGVPSFRQSLEVREETWKHFE